MTRRVPVISIIGRTNVGKSTLFNKLAGRRLAVVEDEAGVTRDRNYSFIRRHRHPFTLIDTGGLVGEEDLTFADSVREQAEIAISESDLIIALFDGFNGLHPQDPDVVDFLRRAGKPVLWVINKCEKKESQQRAADFYQLGIDEVHCISAAHSEGLHELVLNFWRKLKIEDDTIWEEQAEDERIKIAIVGKPNAGKSTLINKLLGEDRLVTSAIAGTTRDEVQVEVKRDDQTYVLVDTAGLRRKARVEDETVERYSNLRTLRALAMCDIAVLMLDATEGLPSDQDARIAQLIHERGKGLIIVVNKWDCIEKDHRTVKDFKANLQQVLKFVRYAPIIFTSALTGKRCPHILEKAKEVYQTARVRIPTSDLNRILTRALQQNQPPVYRGEPIKLFFATQIEVAPPTFVLFMNHPRHLNFSYKRYIQNSIRDEFPFEGTDIRVVCKKRTAKADRESSDHTQRSN